MSLVYSAVALGVVALAGTAVSTVGAISSSQAQSSAANYNSKVEQNNAQASAQQAAFDAQQIQDQTRRNVGRQRAAMAAGGFDVNSGTFSDIQQDTKRQGELSRLSRIYQGKLAVNQSLSRSKLDSGQADADTTAGYYSAGSTLLGGFEQIGSMGFSAELASGAGQGKSKGSSVNPSFS